MTAMEERGVEDDHEDEDDDDEEDEEDQDSNELANGKAVVVCGKAGPGLAKQETVEVEAKVVSKGGQSRVKMMIRMKDRFRYVVLTNLFFSLFQCKSELKQAWMERERDKSFHINLDVISSICLSSCS